MRSVILRGALVLATLGTGLAIPGCEQGGRGTYQEGGGNQRIDLPEEARQGSPQRGVQRNVEVGDESDEALPPGRQREPAPQADGRGGPAGREGAGEGAAAPEGLSP